jgi:hypothetical protein
MERSSGSAGNGDRREQGSIVTSARNQRGLGIVYRVGTGGYASHMVRSSFIAVAVLALVVGLTGCKGSAPESPSTFRQDPTPTQKSGPTVIQAKWESPGNALRFVLLYIEAPYHKGQGIIALRRMDLDERTDELVATPNVTGVARASLHSVFATPDGGSVYVAECVGSTCLGGGSSPSDVTVVSRSLDQGVTWETLGRISGRHSLIALTSDGLILGGNGPDGTPGLLTFPSQATVDLPPTSDRLRAPVGLHGGLFFPVNDGVSFLDSAGRISFALPIPTGARLSGILGGTSRETLFASWVAGSSGNGERTSHWLGQFRLDAGRWQLERALELTSTEFLHLGQPLSDQRVLASISVNFNEAAICGGDSGGGGVVPVVIDLAAGSVIGLGAYPNPDWCQGLARIGIAAGRLSLEAP